MARGKRKPKLDNLLPEVEPDADGADGRRGALVTAGAIAGGVLMVVAALGALAFGWILIGAPLGLSGDEGLAACWNNCGVDGRHAPEEIGAWLAVLGPMAALFLVSGALGWGAIEVFEGTDDPSWNARRFMRALSAPAFALANIAIAASVLGGSYRAAWSDWLEVVTENTRWGIDPASITQGDAASTFSAIAIGCAIGAVAIGALIALTGRRGTEAQAEATEAAEAPTLTGGFAFKPVVPSADGAQALTPGPDASSQEPKA